MYIRAPFRPQENTCPNKHSAQLQLFTQFLESHILIFDQSFPASTMLGSALSVLAIAVVAKAAPQPEAQMVPPMYDIRETFVVGDGDPQQVYFYKQLSVRTTVMSPLPHH